MVANTVAAPALVLEKQVAQVEVKAGDLADYTFECATSAVAARNNLILTDILPGTWQWKQVR